MRSWTWLVLVGGCYGPHPPLGVSCDPGRPACPSGQHCVGENGGFFCDSSGVLPGPGPDAQTRFVYRATVAECVDPAMPNPDKCRSIKGNDQLCVDKSDETTLDPWDAFVRFDLDSAFGNATVQGVTLELTATDASTAPSPNSGKVWQVAPFAKMDLYGAEPMQLGMMPLAPSQGAVAKNDVIRWTLPADLVTPGGSVFLELTSDSGDGVNYWNLEGDHPPRLAIDAL